MSIKLGIHEVFSYTLPGSLYLLSVLFYTNAIDLSSLRSLQLWEFLVFLAVAYLLGILLDPITVRVWYRIFVKEDTRRKYFESFKKNYPELDINFNENHWPILLSYIRSKDHDIPPPDRYASMKIMLRNLSFGLFLISLAQLTKLLLSGFDLPTLISILLAVFFSIIAGGEAAKFDHWMISQIFEEFTAYSMEPSWYIGKKEKSKNHTTKK